MFRGNFIKPAQKLWLINNINLPMDVLNIVKDFAFYTENSMVYIKQLVTEKKELGLIRHAWSRNNSPYNTHLWDINWEKDTHWMFGFTHENGPHETLQLQGMNCKKCGEYTYYQYKYKANLHANGKICSGNCR